MFEGKLARRFTLWHVFENKIDENYNNNNNDKNNFNVLV